MQIKNCDTNDVIIVTIDLFSSGNEGRRTTQIVEAMSNSDMLSYRLNKFGNKLMSLIIDPLMSQNHTIVEIEKSGEPLNKLQITFGPSVSTNTTSKSQRSDTNPAQESKLTMDRLEEIFFFLLSNHNNAHH